MTNYARQLEAATAAAHAGAGVGGRTGNTFKVGAALYKGKRLITAGCNTLKTHTALARLSPYPHIHAETAVILRHGIDNCAGLNLFVSRVRKDGTTAMAKPCEVCQQWIGLAKFKNVFFTTDNGGVDRL
jgi:tRNA(Arg) A34 adenosine deaminase TadA